MRKTATAAVRARAGNRWLAVMLLALLSLIWGSSFILIKKGLVHLAPMEVGSLRIFTAWVILLPIAFTNFRKVPRHKWKFLISAGVIGSFIPSLLFSLAGSRIGSATSGALNALTPFLTTAVAATVFKARVTGSKWLGLIIGLAGALLLALSKAAGGSYDINQFALLVFVACACYAVNLNLTKVYLDDLPPEMIASISIFAAGIPAGLVLFGATDFAAKLAQPRALGFSLPAVMVLGAVGTATAQLAYNRLIKLTSAVYASTVTYLMPCVAIVWGLIDGEQLATQHFMGIALIIAGVFLVNRR